MSGDRRSVGRRDDRFDKEDCGMKTLSRRLFQFHWCRPSRVQRVRPVAV